MKTIYYNNKLAGLVLFDGYSTIMLFGFILTRHSRLSLDTETHEQIHQLQYAECMLLGLLPSLPLCVSSSWLWLLLIPVFYYLLYLGGWLSGFARHLFMDWREGIAGINHKAYNSVPFEREARINQGCGCYFKEREWFAWFRYYGKI